MILKPNEVCPYSNKCPYHHKLDGFGFCHGTAPRDTDFSCDYVDNSGNILEHGEMRNRLDITGKMKFIQE